MEETAIEREKRRQRIERKKKKQRQLMVLRIAVAAGGLCIVIGVFKIAANLIKSRAAVKSVSAEQSMASVEQNVGAVKAGVQDSTGKKQADQTEESIIMTSEDMQKGNLILVNEQYPLRSYDDSELVKVAEHNEGLYRVRSKDTKLNPEALTALNRMIRDFTEAQGENDIGVMSGYRTYDEQEKLHFEAAYEKQSEDTDIFVAKPDRSEHHTGLAVDLGLYYEDGTSSEFDGTGIYEWITENCYKYGFVIRYQEDKKEKTGIGSEPWHLRYVGVIHAGLMKELNLCLEEYIEYLKNYRYYTNPLQKNVGAVKNYSIYYVPATGEMTQLPIPQSKSYTVSGNNKDGFIVTVMLN